MSDSVNLVSLSVSRFEDEQQGCMFCEEEDLCFPEMICTALHEKHSNGQDSIYLRDINDILEERLCEATVRYLEMIFLSEEEEMLKREYLATEYNRKITALGEYYKFHRDVPRVHAMPIERILTRHYDRRREHQYKQVRRLLKDEQNMPIEESENSMSHHSSYVKKSRYSTMLGDIKESFLREENKRLCLADEFVEKSQSVALFEVYDKLSEIVRAVPDIQDMGGSYLQNSGVRHFQNWIKKCTRDNRRKQEDQANIEHDFTKKKVQFHTDSKKKLVLKYNNPRTTYNTLNMDYRKVLQAKHNTIVTSSGQNSAQKANRPVLKLTEYMGSVPLKLADKERSIEKIYGLHTDSKPLRIYQRILTADKRPQDSTNGSSNRLEIGGRSKSIDRVTLEKMIDRAQLQQQQQQQQSQPRPVSRPRAESTKRTRSVSRQQLQRYQPRPPLLENRAQCRSTSNMRGKKTLSTPTLRNDIRISRPRPVQSRKVSVDSNRRHHQGSEKRSASRKNIQQLQMLDIMIQKKTKVDPGIIYKRIKNMG